MKEATGELSMTVVTIIAIVAIAGIVTWLAPKVKTYVETSWSNVSGGCPDGQVYDAAKKVIKNERIFWWSFYDKISIDFYCGLYLFYGGCYKLC